MSIDLEYLKNEGNINEFDKKNIAMNNAYKLLIGGLNNWELEFTADDNPHNQNTTYKSIETLISYFQTTEEYEKCNNLKKLKIIRNKTWI